MARQVRIEFPGALYHVMARGDRRELIVRDDEDRRTFVRTLGEGCERAGFRVHEGLEAFSWSSLEPISDGLAGVDCRACAEPNRHELDWIRATLNVGERFTCCRLIQKARKQLPECRDGKVMRAEILKNINKP
jgi:hypothetical protein